jgi:competence protein ComEC
VEKRARRPSVLLLAAFWSGLLAGPLSGDRAWIFLILLLPGLAGFLILKGARTGLCLLAVCMVLLGVLRSPDSSWNVAGSSADDLPDRFPVVLEAAPVLFSSLETGRFKARVRKVIAGWPSLEGRVVLLDPEACPGGEGQAGARAQQPGDGWVVAGTFRKPGRPMNPFAVDMRAQARRRGVAGYISSSTREGDGPGICPGRRGRMRRGATLRAFRARITALIRRSSHGACRGVLESMLLGERRGLSTDVRSLMIRAGTYHVLAISGLHVGIMVLLLTSSITVLRLPRSARLGLAVACIIFYVILTGARPSALRAGMFFALLSLCRLLQWRIDYPNAVCAAGTLLLFAFPHLAWDLGFKLSLGAVFGITLLVPQLHRARMGCRSVGRKVLQYATLGMMASFCAQVFTLPAVLHHFGRTSLAGILTNLVVLPLTTLIVAAGLEASVAVLVWDPLAEVFMRAAATFVDAMLVSMSAATGIVDSLLITGRPAAWKAPVYYAIVMYLGFASSWMKRPHKIMLLAGAYAFMLFSIPSGSGGELTATFLHVGDGDACLVETPAGKTMLVDCGPCGEDYDAADLHLIPFLALKGISRLDIIFITHPHSDHYGGLGTLAANLEIGEILVGTVEGEAAYRRMLADARAGGARIRELRRGESFSLDCVRIECLHPSDKYGGELPDANAGSLVFTLQLGEVRLLFTGDVTPGVQRELLTLDLVPPCQVLKVPHHGAPNALGVGLLDALDADWAVIPAGTRFRLHPAPETLSALEAAGVRTFTTSRDGAVTAVTDGRSIDVVSRIGEIDHALPYVRQ